MQDNISSAEIPAALWTCGSTQVTYETVTLVGDPGSNLASGRKDSELLIEAAVIYLFPTGGGRTDEQWEMGHNFGETVRFWVFVRRKGPHVHLSHHTHLYSFFKFHLPQVPHGMSLAAAVYSPPAFLQYTLQNLSTYPISYLYSSSC